MQLLETFQRAMCNFMCLSKRKPRPGTVTFSAFKERIENYKSTRLFFRFRKRCIGKLALNSFYPSVFFHICSTLREIFETIICACSRILLFVYNLHVLSLVFVSIGPTGYRLSCLFSETKNLSLLCLLIFLHLLCFTSFLIKIRFLYERILKNSSDGKSTQSTGWKHNNN